MQWAQAAAVRLQGVAGRLGGRLSSLRGQPKAVKPLPLGTLKLTLKAVEVVDHEADVPAFFVVFKCGPHWGRTSTVKASRCGHRPSWDWQVPRAPLPCAQAGRVAQPGCLGPAARVGSSEHRAEVHCCLPWPAGVQQPACRAAAALGTPGAACCLVCLLV